jgi:hypothetical protein
MLALTRTIHPQNCSAIGCSILVFDKNDEALSLIKSLARVGDIITPEKNELTIAESIAQIDVTQSDICAVFLSEEFMGEGLSGFDIAEKIHAIKSCIPLFMRLTGLRSMSDLTARQRQTITAAYSTCKPGQFKKITNSFLYGLYFPNQLVNIFSEAGLFTLNTVIKHCEIISSRPFLIYDHTLAAEYTSMLPIQLPFGNGTITFSISEHDTLNLIKNEHTALKIDQTSVDHCNQLISEITNQYWGKVRRMCELSYGNAYHRPPINVPIVVNHKLKYINFGNHTPQLCFRYLLIRDHLVPEAISVEFKIIFSTILRPKDFCELMSSGEERQGDDGYESFL